ncbi:MAG: exopolysaccharide biosynthesis protein [Candidatus Eremiobacteraeota bacterium]|nr:exopolysaccharide biosynthesis protein [Candidatus Eremiobacteraeota bacterium]
MIFVVLGTCEMPFVRPLVQIEEAVRQGLIPKPVVVQSGRTSYASPDLNLVPFYVNQELEQMYEQAALVICQADVGSIMLGLRKQKKVIAIARLSKFAEHHDDQQLEILDTFTKSGAVLPWNGDGDLPDVLRRVENFVSAGYPFCEEKISRSILDYLDANVKGRF